MNKDFQVGWWLVVLTIVLMLLADISFAEFFLSRNEAAAEYVVSIIGESVILIPSGLGILYILLSERKTGRKNGLSATERINEIVPLKKAKASAVLLGVPAMLGAQYFITYLTLPVQALLILLFGAETATSQMLIPRDAAGYILAFAALCVAAPIAEEILCRGVLMRLFGRYGVVTALISSSLAFALLHFEARTFIQILFVGLLLGTFRICTGSVIPGIIMHSANNLLSLCQLSFPAENEMFLTLICIVLAVLFVPIMFLLFYGYEKNFSVPDMPMNRTKTGFSLGACICVCLFVLFNLGVLLERIINL